MQNGFTNTNQDEVFALKRAASDNQQVFFILESLSLPRQHGAPEHTLTRAGLISFWSQTEEL